MGRQGTDLTIAGGCATPLHHLCESELEVISPTFVEAGTGRAAQVAGIKWSLKRYVNMDLMKRQRMST
jgi:hypothetical protein